MKLSKLIDAINVKQISGTSGAASVKPEVVGDLEIGSLHYSAQDVRSGGLFVAISGLAADGHDYVDEALKNGAVTIVSQKPL